jgi:Bacterial Ig-like domain
MYIGQWQGSGRWHFQSASIYDRVGNRQDYTRGDLASMGGDHTFRVIGRVDKARPSMSGFHISTRHVDVRTKPKPVSFSTRARDGVSGIQFGYAALFRGSSLVALIGMRASKPGAHDTFLKGKMTLRPCNSARGVFGVRMYAFDNAGNYRLVKRGTLTVQAKDRTQPRAAMTAFTQDPNSIKINFNENVDGVSIDSVVFSSVSTPLVAIPMSTVTCYPEKNLGGLVVNCLTGHVRSADFAPNTAFPTGSYYATINPEGNLDVTDLAGNPFHQTQLYFQV